MTLRLSPRLALLLALGALASGCQKPSDPAAVGPAQKAGAVVDTAAANAAEDAREAAAQAARGARKVEGDARQAAENATDAADAAGERISEQSRQAASNVKNSVDALVNKAGVGVERAGQKIQDASK